jgi:hypothetical protein
MAETQSGPQVVTAQLPPNSAQKQPVGRPRKDGLPAGSQTPPPLFKPEDFFLMLPTITAEEWQYRAVYVYRHYPITDRRNTGNYNYITKYGEPIDTDRIMRDFGSGTYQVELVETAPNAGGKKLAACSCRIMNMDYPPKVPAGEWVNDPRNADWEWCRAKLGPQAQAAGGQTAEDIANAVTKVYREMHPESDKDEKGVLPAILNMIGQNQTVMMQMMDPSKQISTVSAIITALHPPKAAEPDPLIQMLMDDRKAMREEMLEARKQLMDRKPEKSPLEWLLENDEVMERARRLFGKGNSGGAGQPSSSWVAVAEKAVEKLGGPLGQIAMAVTSNLMRGPQTQQPQRPATPTQTQSLPPAADQPQQQQRPAETPAQQTQPIPQDPDQMKAMELWNKYGNAIQQSLPFIIDKFRDEFPDGYECRDWFMSPQRFGNVVWEGLRTDIGTEGFIGLAKQWPDVWKNLQPEEKFRAFIQDFFTRVGEERPEYFGDDEPAA